MWLVVVVRRNDANAGCGRCRTMQERMVKDGGGLVRQARCCCCHGEETGTMEQVNGRERKGGE